MLHIVFAVLLLLLAGCGGSGMTTAMVEPPVVMPPVVQTPEEPTEGTGTQEPTPPPLEIAITHGPVQDSADRDTVIRYLNDAIANPYQERLGIIPSVIRPETAPTLHMAEGTTDLERSYTRRAIEIVNSALPYQNRIRIGTDVPNRVQMVPNGQIFIDFAAHSEWPVDYPNAGGYTQVIVTTGLEGETLSNHIWISDRWEMWVSGKLELLVHEIMHAMGMADHVEDFVSAINANTLRSIQPIDRDGLAALYLLNNGDRIDELGHWSDTSMNIGGSFDDVSFGVRSNNGVFTPWIDGPAPQGDITHLTGIATWNGKLVGFTPAVEAVVGNASLGIDLETLTGNLDFSALEYWPTGQAPEGTGAQWGTGSLAYDVGVNGNSFTQTGGDAGTVNGSFFGTRHESMAGTVEREDLSAAFGGRR